MGNDFFFLVEQMGTPKKHWFVHFNRTNGQWYFLFSRTHGQIHPWAIPLGTISKPKFFGLLAGLFNALSSSSPHFLSFTQSSLHRWPIERAKHFLHLSANGICTLIYMVISNPTQEDWVSYYLSCKVAAKMVTQTKEGLYYNLDLTDEFFPFATKVFSCLHQ